MSQALYTSKTGISAGQTQVDVIANNVANINTTAYKTANVTFSTLFSKTLSSGSAATTKGGGTNPKQIGLGTQVASISRDFNSGSFQATGITSDFMISGKGYFVVQDADGNQYLTRDGHFSLDSAGNLTTANGFKVVGTTNSYSNISGTSTIKVATQLNATVKGTDVDQLKNKLVSELNCVSFNKGQLVLNVGGTSTQLNANLFSNETDPGTGDPTGNLIYDAAGVNRTYTKIDNTNPGSARDDIIAIYGEMDMTATYYKANNNTYIKAPIPTTGYVAARNIQKTVSYNISESNLTGTLEDFLNSINNDLSMQGYADPTTQEPTIKFSLTNGQIILENRTGETLSAAKNQGCNFLSQTGLDDALSTAIAGQTVFYSNDVNQSVDIRNATSYNDAASLKDWTISEGGVISATYSDGSSLTVTMDNNDKVTWKYISADNVTITGSGANGTDVDTTYFDVGPGNMILELATVVNEGGLLAQPDNLWTIGPNAGDAYYGVSGGHGIGTLKAGGLEGSNVDMATELSNMIMAQRAIQVNSRVFSTASNILETLAYLGQ